MSETVAQKLRKKSDTVSQKILFLRPLNDKQKELFLGGLAQQAALANSE